MSTLQQRIAQALEAGFTQADLMRATGVSSGAVSFWKNGQTKELKADSALALAKLTGWRVDWWATGVGPREAAEVVQLHRGVAHSLSQPKTNMSPQATRIAWGDIVTKPLPEEFALEVLDDSMAPLMHKGDVARFSTTRPRDVKRPVLVVDSDGQAYIRDYLAGRGDQFVVQARAPGYLPLDSQRDGLRVVAVLIGVDWS